MTRKKDSGESLILPETLPLRETPMVPGTPTEADNELGLYKSSGLPLPVKWKLFFQAGL